MKKFLTIILLLWVTLYAQNNDSIINYIFVNRHTIERFSNEITIAERERSFMAGTSARLNIWQRENLFAENTTIEAFYEHSEEIIRSIANNRRLTREPSFFNVVIPLIKERRLGTGALRNVPVDILVKNQGRIRDLLDYLVLRDSQQWNDGQFSEIFDQTRAINMRYRGYALTAVMARLPNARDYQMLYLQNPELRSILIDCKVNVGRLRNKRFISATELLSIAKNCPDDRVRRRAISFVERNASDSVINLFVNQNFSREELVTNFLRDPVRYNWYVRRLADDWVISQIVPYLVDIKQGNIGATTRTTEFAYFIPLVNILRELYYDFDLEGKHFQPERNFDFLSGLFYAAQRQQERQALSHHRNQSFSDVFSENYMDFVRRYEEWIRNRFGVGLNRQPQTTDIIDNNPAWRIRR